MFKALAICIPIFLILGCGEEKQIVQQPSVSIGETHWKSSCASCHGANALGVPEIAPTVVGSTFVANSSDKELSAYITVGRKADDPRSVMNLEMPAKGGNPMLKETDILSIVAYIRSIQ
ncbi:MAG: cytochrome c [Phycisphaerales bacterium]|nr:cytochrome c [Phycisphaerales bacterium]